MEGGSLFYSFKEFSSIFPPLAAPITSLLAPPQTSYLFPALLYALQLHFLFQEVLKRCLQSSTCITLQFVTVFSLVIMSTDREKLTWKCRKKTLVFSEMRGEFWYRDMSQRAVILDRKLWLRKKPIGRIFRAQTTSAWSTVEIRVCSLDFVL